MQITARGIIIAALIILVSITAAAVITYALYTVQTPHVQGTPGAQATATLTASTLAPVSGVPWTLTAHISDNLQGLTVRLYNNSVQVDTETTNAQGNAVFTVAPTAAFNYYAEIDHP